MAPLHLARETKPPYVGLRTIRRDENASASVNLPAKGQTKLPCAVNIPLGLVW
jgi:hypothetical protein